MSKLIGYVTIDPPVDLTRSVGYGMGALEINPGTLFTTRPKPSAEEGPQPLPHWVWIAGSMAGLVLLVGVAVALKPWAAGGAS